MSGNNGTHPVIASSPRSRTDPSGIGVASSAARHPSLAPPPSGPKRTNKSWNIGTRNRLAPLRGIPLGLLAKHLIITGKPGSGKTTALMNIVIQLCQQGIPFILIEPVKKEYRLLKTLQAHANPAIRQLAQNLRIFTLGNESVSPGRLGLFGLLPGIREEEHIEHLLHAAAASMPLSSSLPFLLGESFEEVYETFRGRERFPAAGDLLAAAQRVCSRKGYSAATGSDIETALMTRLGSWTRRSLGKVLQSPQSVPSPQSLVRSQTLFELDDLPEEQACLVILFLLTALRETFKTLPPGGKGLRCVILLDEAHVVIGRQDQASPSEEFADPKSFATEYFGRMMRELRALRVGLVIADQNASSLAASVLKNACSHLAYRQTAAEDHALLASAMLLSEADCEDLARLEPGEAFFMTEGFYGPRRIRTVHLQRELGECVAPTDAELLEIISKEEWWLEAARERLGCDLMLLSEKLAGLGARLKTWMERAASLRERLAQASGMEDRRAWVKAGKAITASMSQELDRFRRESYRPLLGEDIPGALSALAEIMTHRDTIKQRFEEVMEPAAKSVIRTVEKMAA